MLKMSKEVEDANEFTRGLQLNSGTILGMVMKAAIELNLFEIMAKASTANGTSPFGDAAKNLSSDDIVSHLPAQNPATAAMLDRVLHWSIQHSVLNSSTSYFPGFSIKSIQHSSFNSSASNKKIMLFNSFSSLQSTVSNAIISIQSTADSDAMQQQVDF